jgi:hypothetical protein
MKNVNRGRDDGSCLFGYSLDRYYWIKYNDEKYFYQCVNGICLSLNNLYGGYI